MLQFIICILNPLPSSCTPGESQAQQHFRQGQRHELRFKFSFTFHPQNELKLILDSVNLHLCYGQLRRKVGFARSMSNLNRKLCGWVRQLSRKRQGTRPWTIKPLSQMMSHYSMPQNTWELQNASPVLKRKGQRSHSRSCLDFSRIWKTIFCVLFNKRNTKIRVTPMWLCFDSAILDFAKSSMQYS